MLGNIFKKIFSLNNRHGKIFLILSDLFIFFISILIAQWLYEPNDFLNSFKNNYLLIPIISFFGIPFVITTGQYKNLTRYIGSKTFYVLALRQVFLVFFTFFGENDQFSPGQKPIKKSELGGPPAIELFEIAFSIIWQSLVF